MSLQLIFVVETNKKCKSDWIYIKETIDYLYQYDQTKVKLSPVYMDGKGKFKKKETEIRDFIKKYASQSKDNRTGVIYCFDCDDYDVKQECATFLKDAREYCQKMGYDFVWFCKDVEHVYLGRQIPDSQKQKEAADFKRKKGIATTDVRNLVAQEFRIHGSNIARVLERYGELERG